MHYFIPLSRKIAKLRNKKGYTQRDFSKKVGISSSYLSKIESGAKIRGCSIEILWHIANGFGLSLAELLTLDKHDYFAGFLYGLDHNDNDVDGFYTSATKDIIYPRNEQHQLYVNED